jgi:N-acetylglucosamine-6-phosphate deacetylase
VAAGHTDATFEQLVDAAARGVTHVTHLFNGMRGIHHREPGAAGAALTLDRLRCELIADGVHVAPAVMDLVWRAKGPDGLLLVTDTNKTTGLPAGQYTKAGRTVTVRDGSVRLADGTITGSATPMAGAVRRFAQATGAGIEQLWPVASRNPAEAAGVADRKGSLVVGKDADLVVLDDHLDVWATVVEGRLVHQR